MVIGDPHALDPGAALTPLALRAAAAVAGWPEVPPGAAGRRQLWAAAGVDCDPLSASVLVHGVRPGGAGLLARQLRESAEAGEPRRVTLRELERSDLSLDAGAVLHVCENPAVVAAAADALGARSAALACAEGVPSTAVMQLLRRAVAGGVRLRVRADFDWPGLRIAAQLMAAGSAEPWRFSARDYETAVAAGRTGPPLDGPRERSMGPRARRGDGCGGGERARGAAARCAHGRPRGHEQVTPMATATALLSSNWRGRERARPLRRMHTTGIFICMRTTLNLDEKLLERARRLSGLEQKTQVIHAGLEALIARESAKRLADLGGTEPQLTAPRRRRPRGRP